MITVEMIAELLGDRRLFEVDRIKQQKENIDPGFNLFNLISDLYYRENLHSDVICAILDVNGKHQEGNKYLLKFIQLVNLILPSKIDISNYIQNVVVVREEGRRDITISGLHNHVIIIENKINDASDTSNQIPRYVEKLEARLKEVDAIVYLTLNQAKEPDESSWQVNETKRTAIKRKLVSIRAFNGTSHDLCAGWLEKCIQDTNNLDSLSILRQYLKIIKYLTRKHMDQNYLQEFKEYLISNPQNVEVALSIKDTLNEYPKFILLNIYNYFKEYERFLPFQSVASWVPRIYYFNNYVIGGYCFNIDFKMDSIDKLIIDFSVRQGFAYQKLQPETVLRTVNMLPEFTWQGDSTGRFIHVIEGSFIQFEDKAIEFLTRFLSKLKSERQKVEDNLLQLPS